MKSKTDDREKIHINMTQFTPGGKIRLKFSEALNARKEFEKKGVNMSLINSYRNKIFNITFIRSYQDEEK